MSNILYISDVKDFELLRTPVFTILNAKKTAKVEIKTAMLKNNPGYGYYYGVIIPRIKEAFEASDTKHLSDYDIDQYLKQLFFYEEKIINGAPVKIVKSKEIEKPGEFSAYLRRVLDYCRALKIFIPAPMY